MRFNHSFYIAFILVLLCGVQGRSQDVGFSQFYAQPMLRNPALAGIFTGDLRFTASYRNQWQSFTNPYRTFGLSSEVKFPLNLSNVDMTITGGLQLMRDIAGTSEYSTTQALPVINGSIRVMNNSFLSVGFMGGLMQQRFDPTKLVLNDQFVAGSNGSFSIRPYSNQSFTNTNVNYGDLSTGVCFSSSIGENVDYYVGAGIFHLLKPKVGFFEGDAIVLNRKLSINAGLSNAIGDRDELTFYGDYFSQFSEDSLKKTVGTFQTGVMISHDIGDDENRTITIGGIYRLNDALIPVIQLQLNEFTIGASYDVNISKLAVASQARGGVEITLSYRGILNSRNPDLRSTKCPVFGRHSERINQ